LNVTGYFHAELGVGEAARLLTRAIEATGTPHMTASQATCLSRQQHRYETRTGASDTPFDINLLCVNADVTAAFARDAGPAFFADRHTIGYWFWEVDPLPPLMHSAFDHVDEIWTATEYVGDIVRAAAAGRKPVYTVPLPLLPPRTVPAVTREQLGLPADRFVFLFVFDFLSVMERKNPLGAIEAFCAAFAPGEGPVLVLKSINGDLRVADLERLKRAAAHRSDIVIRDEYLSAGEKNALVAACDCYVSLHRAEGLGLTLAEAMALGKPAIATGYSGNLHFMTGENSFLVEYQLASAGAECGPYPSGARWAEPDLQHAAQLMRAVYQYPDEAVRRGERGRADLLFNHGVMASASAISRRLAGIRQTRAATAVVAVVEEAVAPDPVVETGALLPISTVDVALSPDEVATPSAALAAFTAVLPQLREIGAPRLSRDERSWQWVRRAAQRAMFRVIRPYWYQQRQFQDALLDAVHGSLERLAAPGPASPVAPPSQAGQIGPGA
jgi:glycosyltransferase involved in cell wall biosynthesis